MEVKGGGSSLKAFRILRLPDLDAVVGGLVDLLRTNASGLESIVVLSQQGSGQLQFDSLRSSSHLDSALKLWLGGHFEKHPLLYRRLLRSELVMLSSAVGTNSHYSQGIHGNVVLAPVLFEGGLIAAFGLLSRTDGPHATMTDLEYVRWCASEAAAPLARMAELEVLRKENERLRECAERLTPAEGHLHQAAVNAAQSDALGAIRANLQQNVAHDLRTPLAAVRGYARMMLDGHAGAVTSAQQEYLEVAIENTNKLIHLVNWMSRIADAAETLALGSFDLRELWRECLAGQTIEETTENSAATFEVTADRGKIQRALQQLIRAAIHFSGPAARLSVEFSRPRKGGVGLRLSGMRATIPAEAVEFPFNSAVPFNLADVNDIIGMHGGRLFVRRAEEGSLFMFTLPALPDLTINTGHELGAPGERPMAQCKRPA